FTSDDLNSPFQLNVAGSCYQTSTNNGPYAGGNSVTFTNGSFGTITNVLIGAPSVGSAIPTAQGSNWFTITMPSIGTNGTFDIIVQTDSGDTTLANAYTYNPVGFVTQVTPSSGSWTGNYPVVITGTNLGNGADIASVTLCGIAATISSQAADRVWIEPAAVTNGMIGDVVVQSTSYGTTIKSNAFTYLMSTFTLFGTNGMLITNNNTAMAADGTDLGEIIVGQGTLTNIFMLTNSGNTALNISGVSTSGAGASCFTLQLTSSVISVSSVVHIPVVFNPQGGERNASFTFANNATNAPFVLNVKAYGKGGGIALATNSQAFTGTYQSNNPASQTFGVTNVGMSGFTYTNIISYSAGASGWLSCLPASGSVPINGATVFTNRINLSGLNAGTYYATNAVTAFDATNSPQMCVVALTVDRASQGITFANPGTQLTTNKPVISATSTSGLPVSFEIVSGSATLSQTTSPATVTFTAAGDVTIRARQQGNTNWYAAPSSNITFTVNKTPQATLNFTPSSPQIFGTTNPLTTTGGSGTGAVSYAVASGGGTIVGSTNLTTTTGMGSVTVVATKATDAMYLPITVTSVVTCAKANQIITFGALSDTFWTSRPTLSATASSGMPVNFAVTNGPAIITNATTLLMNGYGSVSIQATQSGDHRYNAAPYVSRTFNALGPQFILLGTNGTAIGSGVDFQSANGTYFGDAIIGLQILTNTFTLTNSGTASMTISNIVTNGASFSLDLTSSVVSVSSVVHIPITFDPQTGATNTGSFVFQFDGTNSPYTLNVGGFGLGGGISLASNQLSYTATYLGADPAVQSVVMTNVGLSGFTFTNTIPASWLSVSPTDGTVPLNGTTTLTFTVAATNLNVGTYITTNVISAIDATNSPQSIIVTLQVAKASQAITFPNAGTQLTTNTTLLTATATSGLAVTYAVISGPAVLATNQLTYTNSGTVVVQASQAGNSNWLAANSVTQTFAVTKAVASVSLTNLTQTYDRGAHTATVTCVPSVPYTVTYNGSASAPVNAGSYTVVATAVHPIWQGGATNTLTIQKSAQTVTFPGIDSQKTTNLVVLAASASSGYPVAFSVNYGPAVIGGFSNMTFTGAGMVSVGAVQAGNSNWLAAGVTNTFMVSRADQTPLVFAPASPQIYDTTNQL
ncbi:MAG: DUF1573 domain-containing protein, partial [Spartobacteria bacterium]|nr:DUF1573 domain-containing protein [Spartobacteria bacterium]